MRRRYGVHRYARCMQVAPARALNSALCTQYIEVLAEGTAVPPSTEMADAAKPLAGSIAGRSPKRRGDAPCLAQPSIPRNRRSREVDPNDVRNRGLLT